MEQTETFTLNLAATYPRIPLQNNFKDLIWL